MEIADLFFKRCVLLILFDLQLLGLVADNIRLQLGHFALNLLAAGLHFQPFTDFALHIGLKLGYGPLLLGHIGRNGVQLALNRVTAQIAFLQHKEILQPVSQHRLGIGETGTGIGKRKQPD